MAADILSKNDNEDVKKPFLGNKNGAKVEFSSGQDTVNSLLARAHAQSQKAEKNGRPSITCWKPQHRKAGDEFCQAAMLYCEAGDHARGMAMLLKACDSYKKKRIWYSAAKTLDQAMTLAQEEGDMTGLAELAWRSAALYRKAGHPDSAAHVLEHAGKAVEVQLPKSCLAMLEKAAETVETENRPIQAACYTNKLLKIALSQNSMDDALEKSKKLVHLYQEAGHRSGTAKAVMGLVILLLRVGNLDEAEVIAGEYGNYCNRDQAVVIEDLINGFDDHEGEKIESALRSPCMQALEHEYSSVIEALVQMASCLKPMAEEGELATSPAVSNAIPKIKAPIYDGSDELALIDEEESCKGNIPEITTTTDDNVANVVNVDNDPDNNEFVIVGHKPLQKTVTITLPDKRNVELKPRPLRKRVTVGCMNVPNFGPRLEVGGMAESASGYSPSSLPTPSPFLDVTGIDVLNPAQMGMTTDQWREMKRSRSAYDEQMEEDFDDYGI